jgi:hypothetical protein
MMYLALTYDCKANSIEAAGEGGIVAGRPHCENTARDEC